MEKYLRLRFSTFKFVDKARKVQELFEIRDITRFVQKILQINSNDNNEKTLSRKHFMLFPRDTCSFFRDIPRSPNNPQNIGNCVLLLLCKLIVNRTSIHPCNFAYKTIWEKPKELKTALLRFIPQKTFRVPRTTHFADIDLSNICMSFQKKAYRILFNKRSPSSWC